MKGLKVQGRRILALVAALALLVAGPLPARDFFLQEGTEVVLRLHTTVDTEISQKNDRIICTVAEPVQVENVEVIPAGARVLGRVGDIKKPGRFGRGGQMVLSFDSIEVPGAGNVKISGSLVDLYDPEYEDHITDQEMKELKGVDLGHEGEIKGAGPRKLKQAATMGAGAGAGVAAGGGLGAAVGVAVGAGVAFVWFKGKHVELPAGTGMIMRIDRGLTLAIPDMPAPATSNR
jgi:outer membrane lipoprotein SlyB